jgi:hypothetical protein
MYQTTVASYEYGKQGRKKTRNQEAKEEKSEVGSKPDGGNCEKGPLETLAPNVTPNLTTDRSDHLPSSRLVFVSFLPPCL